MFLGLEILSIAVYVLAGMHLRRLRSGEAAHQVLRARRLLVGVLPLRHRPGLRRHRHHQPGRRSPTSSPPTTLGRQRAAAGRLRPAAGRLRLQGRGGAVPLLGARRLRGLAQPGRGLHGVRREGGRLRRAAPGVRRRPSASYRVDWQPIVYVLAVLTLLVGAVLAVVQTDVKRMLAYSSISHAGFILVGVQAATADGTSGRALLPGRLHVHGRRAPSRWSPSSAARATTTTTSPTTGPVAARAAAGLRVHRVPAGPGRRAVHLGLPGQVLRDRRRRRGPLVLAGAGRHALGGHLGLPLPAHRPHDVRRPDEGAEEAEAEAEKAGPRIRIPAAAAIALVVAVVATIGIGLVPDPLTETARNATPELVATPD